MERLLGILRKLESIPSPSGMTGEAIAFLEETAAEAGLASSLTNKGGLLAGCLEEPELMVAGHVDTLGAMVSGIRPDGSLSFSCIGSPLLPSFEAEYATVFTSTGATFRGTLLLDNPAVHVNREAGTIERKPENMHLRPDVEAKTRKDVEALGIGTGDFICFDPRYEVTDTGFVKSRFLDDKAGCAAMADAMLSLGPGGVDAGRVCFYFTNFEEVGHGASAGIPPTVRRMLVVDMGVVGEKVDGIETAVSICVKDSRGPYDFGMRNRLVELARDGGIPFRLDVFPFYSSDGGAALAAGHDVRVALVGPGVSASHGMERTHVKGLKATRDLIAAYVKGRDGSSTGGGVA
ncbi:MAG TPA: M42 family metallopeptidase [Candidatus Fermentibacter daniensis]|mgnify:FL=1|jgi:putative aminopeptidase FrvX|nr:MAG: glucanase [Candidatus Fermentibacter daniensis]MBP7719419.1 M42 family metallopeptidase [Candidatus Fermentibacter sp.]OQC70619.1 MAG: putative aminopeptidase YsdC [candidate division Hyd24-12 bacterium ADurb.Bin004]MCC6872271.1 M42 family metallopeptidase [Candidatus Fermentibacter sp.]NLI01993.1 M42 family metallopeptidase [Candidatus Fermentibacter daniensis]